MLSLSRRSLLLFVFLLVFTSVMISPVLSKRSVAQSVVLQETATETPSATMTPTPISVNLMLYADKDSLTIFVPGNAPVPLRDIYFETMKGSQAIETPLKTGLFSSIDFETLSAPYCLRFVRSTALDTPLPKVCDAALSGKVFTDSLATGDVFWVDSNSSEILLINFKQGQSALIPCQAQGSNCTIPYNLPPTFTPTPTSTATETPNAQTLIAIGILEKTTDASTQAAMTPTATWTQTPDILMTVQVGIAQTLTAAYVPPTQTPLPTSTQSPTFTPFPTDVPIIPTPVPPTIDAYQQYITAGDAALQNKDATSAVNSYSNAINVQPNRGEAYAKRGVAYKVLKNYTAALNDFSTAASQGAKTAKLYFDWGDTYLYIQPQDWRTAINTLNVVFTLNPSDYYKAVTNNDLGIAYYGLGDFVSAASYHEKSLDNASALSQSQVGYVNFRLGAAYAQISGYCGHARHAFQKAVDAGTAGANDALNVLNSGGYPCGKS